MFTPLDLKSGYWPGEEDSIEKTTFVCHRGLFEFTRMPFRLTNASAVFQRIMNHVLVDFVGKFMMVFIKCYFNKTKI